MTDITKAKFPTIEHARFEEPQTFQARIDSKIDRQSRLKTIADRLYECRMLVIESECVVMINVHNSNEIDICSGNTRNGFSSPKSLDPVFIGSVIVRINNEPKNEYHKYSTVIHFTDEYVSIHPWTFYIIGWRLMKVIIDLVGEFYEDEYDQRKEIYVTQQ